MAEEIGEDGRRVRFVFENLGPPARPAPEELVDLVEQLSASDLCPVLNDGRLAGNASARAGDAPDDGLWVTPSGRLPGRPLRAGELVHVVDFDPSTWTARGYAHDDALPTSDTPLHWAALIESWPDFGDSPGARKPPRVALHGHALDDEDSASALGIPISDEATLFSTPEDRAGLLELLKAHPYPKVRIWSRRGHGFFLLDDEYSGATKALASLCKRMQKT